MAPSKLNMNVWIQKLDLDLVSIKKSGQIPSDVQIVGRVLAQFQRFTLDRWANRAESIQFSMEIQEFKPWDSLKARILDIYEEDVRWRRTNKANEELYTHTDDNPYKPKPKKPSNGKPTPQQNDKTGSCCKKVGQVQRECRKKRTMKRRQVLRVVENQRLTPRKGWEEQKAYLSSPDALLLKKI